MSRLIPTLFLLIVASVAFGQDPRLADSLRRDLAAHPTRDTLFVDKLHELAISLLFVSPEGEALELCKQSVHVSDSLGDSLRLAKSYNLVGNCYRNTGLDDRALEQFLLAISLFEALDQQRWLANMHSNIALIYLSRSDFKQALREARLALSIRSRIHYTKAISGAYNTLGNIHSAMNQEDSALKYYLLALDSSASEGNPAFVALYLGNIGNSYGKLNQFALSRRYNRMALEIHQPLGLRAEIGRDIHNIAEAHELEGNLDSAIVYDLQAYAIAQELKYHQLLLSIAISLRKVYEHKGNLGAALHWSTIALDEKDSIYAQQSQGEAEALEMAYRVRQGEQEAAYAKETKQLQQEAALKRSRIVMGSLAGLTLMLAGFGFVTVKRYREKKNANQILEEKVASRTQDLRDTNDQLQREVAQRVAASEALSTFVYRASHDLKGPLTSIKGLVNLAASGQEVVPMIGQKADQLDHVLQQLIDKMEVDERHPTRQSIDMEALLADLMAAMATRAGFAEVAFELQLAPNQALVADPFLLQVALRQLMLNAIDFRKKGVAGNSCKIMVTGGGSHWRILVEDNGVGLPAGEHLGASDAFKRGNAQSKGAGLGLHLAHAAVAKMDATLTLAATPSGTQAIISLT